MDQAGRRFAAASIATRPYIAVASEEGLLVNQHLGEAQRLLIFKQDPESPAGVKFVELRKTPEAGSGLNRWNELGDLLHDCRALLVAAKPEKREYQGWYVRNDEEYGQASDIVVVICAP